MESLFKEIEKMLVKKPDAIIGIDGFCASGKTTVASMIAEKFDVQIIHMDDFFLPQEMRTEERLSQTGGNVHYERFNAEVVSGLEKGCEFAYRAYSCKIGDYAKEIRVLPGKAIIIEGSYSLHPAIDLCFDLKIFVKADYETRLQRILKRNGTQALEMFKSKWIPLENRYFEEFDIESKCDIIIQTEKQ